VAGSRLVGTDANGGPLSVAAYCRQPAGSERGSRVHSVGAPHAGLHSARLAVVVASRRTRPGRRLWVFDWVRIMGRRPPGVNSRAPPPAGPAPPSRAARRRVVCNRLAQL